LGKSLGGHAGSASLPFSSTTFTQARSTTSSANAPSTHF
jgi:hypothetical protein